MIWLSYVQCMMAVATGVTEITEDIRITDQLNILYKTTLRNTQFTHLSLVFHRLMMLHSALSFSMQQTGGEGTDRNQPPVLAGAHTGRKRQQSVPAEGA